MVLHGVIRAAREKLGNVGPLVPIFAVQLNESAILLGRPSVLADVVVEVIVPSLAALLTGATRKLLCNSAASMPIRKPVSHRHAIKVKLQCEDAAGMPMEVKLQSHSCHKHAIKGETAVQDCRRYAKEDEAASHAATSCKQH